MASGRSGSSLRIRDIPHIIEERLSFERGHVWAFGDISTTGPLSIRSHQPIASEILPVNAIN